MSELVVRRLLVDLEAPVARNWCGGNAFATAFFNALSMSFPFGEQFFIDAARRAATTLPEAERRRMAQPLRGFIGQEATHRRLHALFNAHLARQGLVDRWTPRAERRSRVLDGADARHALAVTAATEHFTAVLARWLLAHQQCLEGAEPRLATLWLWHSAEELEHRHVAFDLYRACGGTQSWRLQWYRRVTLLFLSDLARQTLDNLRRERQLWRLATWRAGWQLLMGPQGLLREGLAEWRLYLRADFHPLQQDGAPGQSWLAADLEHFGTVARAAGSHRDRDGFAPGYFVSPCASSSALQEGAHTVCDLPSTRRDRNWARGRCLPHKKQDIVAPLKEPEAWKGEPGALDL